MEVERIYITKGKGEGHTSKSAFDDALNDAGLGNLNLISVSSIIPPGSEIEIERTNMPQWPVGSFVHAVLGISNVRKGETTGIALGWAIAKEGGVIMEQEGHNCSKTAEEDVIIALEEMKRRRSWNWIGDSRKISIEIKPSQPWGSVVVAAVYEKQEYRSGLKI